MTTLIGFNFSIASIEAGKSFTFSGPGMSIKCMYSRQPWVTCLKPEVPCSSSPLELVSTYRNYCGECRTEDCIFAHYPGPRVRFSELAALFIFVLYCICCLEESE